MQRQAIVSAVISTDSQFRTALRECGNGNGDGARIEIAFEVIVPFIELSHGHLEELRYVDPEIVFIDLEGDPVLGCKLAQYLAEQNPNRRLIGAGSGNDVITFAGWRKGAAEVPSQAAVVVNRDGDVPSACANCTPMCPRPPTPITEPTETMEMLLTATTRRLASSCCAWSSESSTFCFATR